MPNPEQLDIRAVGPATYRLEFPYQEDFIAFLKREVPWQDREYDEDTHAWTIHGAGYLSKIESVGVQYFDHVMRIYRRDQETVYRNVRTGTETVQKGLF